MERVDRLPVLLALSHPFIEPTVAPPVRVGGAFCV